MTEYSPLFAELANPARFKMLILLVEAPHTLGEFAQKIELSKPEISRHLTRLMDQGFVQKEDRKYTLVTSGEAIVKLLPPLNFVFQQWDFFKTHRLDLSLPLLREIDALSQADVVSGLGQVLYKLKYMLEETKENDNLLISQSLPLGLDKTRKKPRCGYLIASKSLISQYKISWFKQYYETLETRTLNHVLFGIYISDNKRALLCFPDLNANPDYNEAFFVTDPEGLTYVKAIWEYFWKQSAFLATNKSSNMVD